MGSQCCLERFANFSVFFDFCGDGGSLGLGVFRKVPCANREVILCRPKCLKTYFLGLLEENFAAVGVKCVRRSSAVSFLWAFSTAAAIVTTASFKLSTLLLRTT